MARPTDTELAYTGVAAQAELLRRGEVSAPELVELYLERIARIDPLLGCFTAVRGERAREEAEAAQLRLTAGDAAPLLGVPIALKDNVDVAGEVTSHGTGAVERVATADAEAVRRLRDAGAVILGKTAMPELAMWPHFTESRTFGATRNPWDAGRSPGGSSGGSAAAVAAGLAAGALGSDGGASIRVPAAFCGLFGLKPQRGRVATLPDPEHWYGLTVFGPIARTVADAALLLDVLAGPAGGDRHAPPRRSFAEAARRDPGRLRIVVSLRPVVPARLGAAGRLAVEQTAELLASLGHELTERDPRYGLLLVDGFPRHPAGIRADALRLDRPERLERRTRTAVRLGRVCGGRPVARSLRREAAAAARVNRVLEEHDVLLTPVTARQPPPVGRWDGAGWLRTFDGGRPYLCYTAPWNYTGQPAAAVPAGLDGDGLPTAVQLVGRPRDEATLLALAAQLEAARPWADRRPPL